MLDLDVINAAIALGDKVFPPKGCVIKWFNKLYNQYKIGTVQYDSPYKSHIDGIILCLCTDNRYSTYNIDRDSNLSVISIPDNCIDFCDWDRFIY